jgi:hypothetical protein
MSTFLFGVLVALAHMLFISPLIRSYLVNAFVYGILIGVSFVVAFVWTDEPIGRRGIGIFAILFFCILLFEILFDERNWTNKMKKVSALVKSYLGHAGVYFMFTLLPFWLFAYLDWYIAYIDPNKTDPAKVVSMALIWSALLFGALVAFCEFIFEIRWLRSYMVKTFLHGISTIASFSIAFIWTTRSSNTIERGKTAVYGVLFFSVLYIILASIRCAYHFATKKKKNEKQAYDSIYTPQEIAQKPRHFSKNKISKN